MKSPIIARQFLGVGRPLPPRKRIRSEREPWVRIATNWIRKRVNSFNLKPDEHGPLSSVCPNIKGNEFKRSTDLKADRRWLLGDWVDMRDNIARYENGELE